jgi:23S rRNA-/tRNA-specific pseudouridylate synthase
MCGANLDGYLKSAPMKTETPAVKTVAITADEAGQRIDNFLRTQLKGVPKSMIYRILRKGEVRVNKNALNPSTNSKMGILCVFHLCVSLNVKKRPFRQTCRRLRR